MIKKLIGTLVLAGGAAALVALPQSAAAEDWMIPGNNCYPLNGSAEFGFNEIEHTASFGMTSMCPLLKTYGTDNLNTLWLRWSPPNSSAQPICGVVASNSLGSTDDVEYKSMSGSSATSTVMTIPAGVTSNGYLSVVCTASDGFTIEGIRYTQN
jgi:hypothetical protein